MKAVDYLKMARDGIMNGDKIIMAAVTAAMVKNGTVDDESLAEILKRKDICAGCQFNSRNYKKDNPKYNYPVLFEHCILCRCMVGYEDGGKEYCLECNCGAESFNERNPKNQLEVKWTALKKTEE